MHAHMLVSLHQEDSVDASVQFGVVCDLSILAPDDLAGTVDQQNTQSYYSVILNRDLCNTVISKAVCLNSKTCIQR
jgi:hypothetical protein